MTYSKIILVVGIILVSVFGCSAQNDAQEESQTGKKEVPVITLKNLSPPFKDYDYFKGIKKYGFQIDATSFSLINAWWLAEVSTLVYADEGFVRSQFKKAGLPEVKFFDGRSTQCYVANNDKFAIDRDLPEVERGDIFTIHDTGAHGHAMGFNYNGKLRSAEFLLEEDGTFRQIRRAETVEDYFATLSF